MCGTTGNGYVLPMTPGRSKRKTWVWNLVHSQTQKGKDVSELAWTIWR